MAQFDVHVLRDRTLVVDVQSDVIGTFDTRLVIPLVPKVRAVEMHPRLHPTIHFARTDYLLGTHLSGAIPMAGLGPSRGTLIDQEYVIKAAIDMLISGY